MSFPSTNHTHKDTPTPYLMQAILPHNAETKSALPLIQYIVELPVVHWGRQPIRGRTREFPAE